MQRRKTYYFERPEQYQVEPVPGGSVAFLRENIEEVRADDGTVRFRADEYCMKSFTAPERLLRRIAQNFSGWLASAKAEEESAADKEAGKLTIEDLTAAVLELGELFAEQDDALVELAGLIEEGV